MIERCCDVHMFTTDTVDEECECPSCPFHALRRAAVAPRNHGRHDGNCDLNLKADGPCSCGYTTALLETEEYLPDAYVRAVRRELRR